MAWSEFWLIFIICAGSIILFRVVPMMALADREIPKGVQTALSYIPVAAFTALVANDLFIPGAFAAGIWPAALPFVAAVPVVLVAMKTRSLALCVIVGCAAYALLLLLA